MGSRGKVRRDVEILRKPHWNGGEKRLALAIIKIGGWGKKVGSLFLLWRTVLGHSG